MENPLTREAAVERLIERYEGYFDITRHEHPEQYLEAECDFHVHSSKYVLVKKAKLWEADSNEFIFLFSMPHLTRDIYQACEKTAYELGMQKVKPGPNHMYSYITAIFVCDTCDADAKRALQRCHIYKSFKFSFWGWMDFHTGLADLSTGTAAANGSGKQAAQLLETALFHKQKSKIFKRRENVL